MEFVKIRKFFLNVQYLVMGRDRTNFRITLPRRSCRTVATRKTCSP